jgi:hypothetical protein
VSRGGTIALGGMVLVAAEILAGRQVGMRIEPDTLMHFDLDNRELLHVRPNPLTAARSPGLRGNRPAGPPPSRRWNRSECNAAPPTRAS